MLAEVLIERRAPGHELEAQPFVDHREAARRKRHPLPVDAADIVACARRFVLKSCARGDGLRGGRQFLILQRPDEVVTKDVPLALPAGQPLRFKVAGAGFQGIAHIAPETIARCHGIAGNKLAIKPRRARCFDLCLERYV